MWTTAGLGRVVLRSWSWSTMMASRNVGLAVPTWRGFCPFRRGCRSGWQCPAGTLIFCQRKHLMWARPPGGWTATDGQARERGRLQNLNSPARGEGVFTASSRPPGKTCCTDSATANGFAIRFNVGRKGSPVDNNGNPVGTNIAWLPRRAIPEAGQGVVTAVVQEQREGCVCVCGQHHGKDRGSRVSTHARCVTRAATETNELAVCEWELDVAIARRAVIVAFDATE